MNDGWIDEQIDHANTAPDRYPTDTELDEATDLLPVDEAWGEGCTHGEPTFVPYGDTSVRAYGAEPCDECVREDARRTASVLYEDSELDWVRASNGAWVLGFTNPKRAGQSVVARAIRDLGLPAPPSAA